MNHRPFLIAMLVSLYALALPAQAVDQDLTGTWKWNFNRNSETREIVMKLKQEAARVSGTVVGPDGNSTEIRDGKLAADGKLTFLLEIERDGNTMKINFDGQASGDTITGKTKYINPQGEEREREWVARREPKKVTHDLTGEWASSFKRQDGTAMESELRLRQAGELLTGILRNRSGSEVEIQDGKVQGDTVNFRIVRDRDGRTTTAKYRGKIQEDHTIKGQIDSDWSGEFRRVDWEAKKAR